VRLVKLKLDNYIKYIKTLQEAFHSIETVTGVSDIAEIVTTIIKTGEQHYNLYMHMNTVSAEVDTLEEVLAAASGLISRLKGTKASGEKQADSLLSGLQAQVQGRTKATDSTRVQLVLAKAALEEVYLPIQTLQEVFSSPEYQDMLPTQPSQRLTQASILPALAQLETCLTALLAWQSYVTSSSLSLLSSLPLQKMSYKRFDLTPVSVKSTLADTVWSDEEHEEGRLPLREDQIREKVRKLMGNRSESTPKAVVADHKKLFRTPH